MGKEEKAMRYVQDKMFPHIINASRITDPCFTRDDLRKAYESGYDEGYSEGRTKNLLDQLKKNKDEEAELICKRKQDEAWTEFKKIFYNMETKEDKAKKYGPNKWQNLPDGYQRYKGAMLRHLTELEKGNDIDPETGCLHAAQIVWNAIAMLHCKMKEMSLKNNVCNG